MDLFHREPGSNLSMIRNSGSRLSETITFHEQRVRMSS